MTVEEMKIASKNAKEAGVDSTYVKIDDLLNLFKNLDDLYALYMSCKKRNQRLEHENVWLKDKLEELENRPSPKYLDEYV